MSLEKISAFVTGLVALFLIWYHYAGATTQTPIVHSSYIQPIKTNNTLPETERLSLAKFFIEANLGQQALNQLEPSLTDTTNYDVLLLTAQSYAILNDPITSERYFNDALLKANNEEEKQIAKRGIEKMQLWIEKSKPVQLSILPTIPEINTNALRIVLAKQYVAQNKGQQALDTLKPLLSSTPNYDVLVLAAQSYAEIEKPALSLEYFQKANLLAKTSDEKKIAESGINKMQTWLSQKKPVKKVLSAREKRLERIRTYLAQGEGQFALQELRPLLKESLKFDVLILTGQSYAAMDKPHNALVYFKKALLKANTFEERKVAYFGIAKIQFWIGQYYRAQHSYEQILKEKVTPEEWELATAGLVKSMAYQNRPILATLFIPKHILFTTPAMVIAAAQATLWSDWADITKQLVINYKAMLIKVPKASPLGRDLRDLTWQMNQATWTNTVTPGFFYSIDSEKFEVKRAIVDYTRYWSQTFQSFVGLKHINYTQTSLEMQGSSVYLGQTIRPTRALTIKGQVEPTSFEGWNPTLWTASGYYRPNDTIAFELGGLREIIETFPAFYHHITDSQLNGSIAYSPIPYLQLNGSIYQVDFSDSNLRRGYYLAATTQLSTDWGLSLIVQERGYTNEFVSPYYFSPNRYVADSIILRYGSNVGSVWHYAINAGVGTQLIRIAGVPSSPSPTYQWGASINGPLTNRIILGANYLFTTQASSFTDSPDYKYQSAAVSVKLLL